MFSYPGPDQPPAAEPITPSLEQPAAAASLEQPVTAPTLPESPDVAGAYLETLTAVSAELDAVDSALVRLDQQQFDRCATCGAPIGRERLLADPLLTVCEAHSGS